jgi:hypothetical protein
VGDGNAREAAGVVHQIPRREVVGGVDDEVVLLEKRRVPALEVCLVRVDGHVGVEVGDERARALDLGTAHVRVGVDHLMLEVRSLHHVVVDDAEAADARGREVLDDWRAQAAGPDDEDARLQQSFLSRRPDVVHDDVPGVPVQLGGVEREVAHMPSPGSR